MTLKTPLFIRTDTDQFTMAHVTSAILRTHGVSFALWSGMHAALLGGHRISDDVDFWVADKDMHIVESIFDELPVFTGNNDRRIVRLGDNNEIEIMSHMDVHTPDGVFALRLTDRAQTRVKMRQFGDWRLPCVDPADTILLKAILQRGADKGKHDIEDIDAITRVTSIDMAYLRERIEESGAMSRVGALLYAKGLVV